MFSHRTEVQALLTATAVSALQAVCFCFLRPKRTRGEQEMEPTITVCTHTIHTTAVLSISILLYLHKDHAMLHKTDEPNMFGSLGVHSSNRTGAPPASLRGYERLAKLPLAP